MAVVQVNVEKEYLKILEKYLKFDEIKSKFCSCTVLVQEKYDVIEKENGVLTKVSALKEEIHSLKLTHNSAPLDASKKTQGKKKKAELEKKKADGALKNVEVEKKKVNEAQKVAAGERKKAEERGSSAEKFEVEKQRAARERKRANLAETKLEEQRELAETNPKKVIFEKDRAVASGVGVQRSQDEYCTQHGMVHVLGLRRGVPIQILLTTPVPLVHIIPELLMLSITNEAFDGIVGKSGLDYWSSSMDLD
ncbi:maternal effect embryo arrest 22 [Striga asiatica]|uniref:Maternal effect embryo arrest 22 n=1 Tax=Striga asiatica TaxID=4170 RepID=A0A5A7R8I7_STRAF|nr:maternal effect embryo arrest 22 [Striga asiatica]